MLSSHAIILCYHHVLSGHIIIPCNLPMLSSYVIIQRYHPMISSYVIHCYHLIIIPCYHAVVYSTSASSSRVIIPPLSSHVIIPRYYPALSLTRFYTMSSSHVISLCYHLMFSFIPCYHHVFPSSL
jgi:hypothetical protein